MFDSNTNYNKSFDIIDADVLSVAGRHKTAESRGAYKPHFLYTICERTVCLVALILLSPIILLLMLVIMLDSSGSPIFFQRRIAEGGKRPFWFIKLRTMYADSRRRFPALCAYQFAADEVDNVKLALNDDPRVTNVGRFLRKTSLDELPNLWNVVTGEMTLVGPRPEMWVMLQYYNKSSLRKFSVKPGITGYAQIYGRGDLTLAETIDLDLRYVAEASLKTDLRVLWETVIAVIYQRGAK